MVGIAGESKCILSRGVRQWIAVVMSRGRGLFESEFALFLDINYHQCVYQGLRDADI